MKNCIFILLLSIVYMRSDQPDLFKYNQSTFQAFYFFKNVYIDSNLVEADDWVGTFNCNQWNADSTFCEKLGKCVGSRKWDTSRCGSGVCDLPAMGDGADGKKGTIGYLKESQYPVFLIYDNSKGVYYRSDSKGDVRLREDNCRNGYPFCYGWENFGFYFINTLQSTTPYMDCFGKLGGKKVLDECGICGGLGPQYECKSNGLSYCSEAKYQIECLD